MVDTTAIAATKMQKDEYVRRAAAEFVRVGGMDEPNAIDAAEALYESYVDDPNDDLTPEADAHEDMSYWDDDGDGDD